ncbi:MAG: exonuclease, partial [Pseudomonadota bacterium]
MSLSLDKLRLLRKQAGDPKASTPAAPDVPPAPPAPVAANDARQPPAERSVFAWVEQEIRHKPTGAAASAPAPVPLRR